MTKLIHPIIFIDKLIKKNERGEAFSLMDHQREILSLAFGFDQDGRLPWDTILYSCVKKSGKTRINAALTLAWAHARSAKRILILANVREQALSRVFAAIEGMIQYNDTFSRRVEVLLPRLQSLAEEVLLTKKNWASRDTAVERLAPLRTYVNEKGLPLVLVD